MDSYIARIYQEFEDAGGQLIDKMDELGPKSGNYRTLARTNIKDKTITFYKGTEVQDVIEELLHFKQATKAGVWGQKFRPELVDAWEGQVDNLLHNLGMIPR